MLAVSGAVATALLSCIFFIWKRQQHFGTRSTQGRHIGATRCQLRGRREGAACGPQGGKARVGTPCPLSSTSFLAKVPGNLQSQPKPPEGQFIFTLSKQILSQNLFPVPGMFAKNKHFPRSRLLSGKTSRVLLRLRVIFKVLS